jgi:glycosyltransferase involved in cell wall biosynthesis
MKKDLINFFSLLPQKAIVIPNPVDTGRIDQILLNIHNPYKPGRFHLVSVGRLNYQKGFDLLFRALKKSLGMVSGLHLTIVGEGPEKNSLKRLAEGLGIMDSVSFAGHQDNPFPFMAHADLFISSSRWEGLPNAVLESLACGTPVLAFDCPGGTGEIIIEGENGWLVPAGDFKAMSRKIVKILESEKWQKFQRDSLLPEEYWCHQVVRRYEEALLF